MDLKALSMLRKRSTTEVYLHRLSHFRNMGTLAERDCGALAQVTLVTQGRWFQALHSCSCLSCVCNRVTWPGKAGKGPGIKK